MKLNITIETWQKKDRVVAKCPELDFVAQGTTKEEAKINLLEVSQIQFEEMTELGTLNEYLDECGYEKTNNVAIPLSEMIGFEKYSFQVI